MPFSEKVKLEAKRRAAFRCVICQQLFVQVHHIIPEHDGGSNELSNAAPLCASCHDLFGENPTKRKQIREMRDYWFEVIRRRMEGDLDNMFAPLQKSGSDSPFAVLAKTGISNGAKGIALYHCMYAHESFELTAVILLKLIANAQKRNADEPRILYLDIEEHRNANGGYDADAYELQTQFMAEFLMQYLTEAHFPMAHLRNTRPQNNDVPDALEILSQD